VRYLVDTDWVIHYLNGKPEIVGRIQDFGAQGLALSFMSLAELYEGVFYSRDPRKSEGLQAFLGGVELLGLEDETTRIFGRERGRLRAQGRTIGYFDLLLAQRTPRTGQRSLLTYPHAAWEGGDASILSLRDFGGIWG